MHWIINKIILVIKKLIRRDLDLDYFSNIYPNIYANLNGTKKHKIIIRRANLSGDLKVNYGSRLLNITCAGKISLGRFVSLNGPSTRLSSRLHGITIGSFTSIASNVVIQEDYHRYDKVSTYFMNKNIFNGSIENDICSKGPITIEEDVWIGSNSVILSGVTIGRGSIVGAGSIVTKNIPRYAIVGGNPARVIKFRFSESVIKKLEGSRWWDMQADDLHKFESDFNKDLNELGGYNEVFTHNAGC